MVDTPAPHKGRRAGPENRAVVGGVYGASEDRLAVFRTETC